MPAASKSAGISSATHASARPAAGPPVQAMLVDDCHAASQRIGASNVSTAPCQSAGNNFANDSNMMIDLSRRCVAFAPLLLDVRTNERRNAGAYCCSSLTNNG